MRCPSCFLELSGTTPLTHCAICGVPLLADVEDVLRHKKFGIVKEVREAQISMAHDVMNLFRHPTPQVLMVEGGTGTGKSYAYLIPALLQLQAANLPEDCRDPDDNVPAKFRVVVSTAKKLLQDQLGRDIPYLLNKMGLETIKWGIVKGRSNYACWKALKDVPRDSQRQFELFIQEARAKGVPADKANWVGDVPPWWEDICIENCSSPCSNYPNCRPHPGQWHLTVTNHSVLAYDLAWGPGKMFSPYNTLVIDEAHKAVESFRSAFSHELRFKYFERLIAQYTRDTSYRSHIDFVGAFDEGENDDQFVIGSRQINQLIARAGHEFTLMCEVAKNVANSKKQVNPTELNVQDLRETLLEVHRQLELIGRAMYRELMTSHNDHDRAMLTHNNRFLRRIESGLAFTERLTEFTATKDVDYVLSLETERDRKGQDQHSLVLQPVEVGPIVGPRLAMVKNTVITSATLCLMDERERPSFEFRKEQFGMTDPKTPFDTVTKVYASPFDYDKNVILYLPTHLSLPANSGYDIDARGLWIREIADEIVRLCVLVGGDTFVLFSSAQDMMDIYQFCNPALASASIPIILHSGEAAQAGAQYMATPSSVLFGKKSFWEGVDIPGNKLRQVIITKLPFPHPDDPVVAALTERYGGMGPSFDRVMVPPMIDDMRQGVGRLIRTSTDKGVIAILDTRVWSGGGRNSPKAVAHLETVRKSKTPTHRFFGKQLINSLGLKTKTNDFTILEKYVNHFFAKRVNARKQGES